MGCDGGLIQPKIIPINPTILSDLLEMLGLDGIRLGPIQSSLIPTFPSFWHNLWIKLALI